mgnify:CR=1 FL=1|tara:strand:+ start:48 stop:704 length:657 start_codon:yes stop_codon:yes gene_type:complete
MKIIALIPLRGGSKSIVDKNIKEIAGKPLCEWTLRAAVESKFIDQVFVSTDSNKIKKVVEGLNLDIKIIDRPDILATDEASTESVMLHFMDQVDFDCLVTIQATSPLLESHHLDSALEYFHSKDFDSLLSAVRTKRFFWHDDGRAINYSPHTRPRRQDFKGTLMENGAFYITKNAILKGMSCRLGGRIGLYEMPIETALEIDEKSDWDSISEILKKKI